ncbi:hypothetical protein Mapa_009574 [Marchantia paleacea]|nr:hypothetical protein Mapa_009574 [Marchantia paleacea]
MIRPAFLLLLVVLGGFEATRSQVHALSSFSIKEGAFRCGKTGGLLCSGNATTTAEGHLKLTPDPPGRNETYEYYFHTVGLALYEQPIQLLNSTSEEVVSFNVSFSFLIEPGPVGAGDGMAFVMFSDRTWIGSAGSSLGAFTAQGTDGVRTFAVEFDTFQNTEFVDIDSNHVGIDFTSVTSAEANSVSGFKLAGSKRVFGWVDYDSRQKRLEVRVSTVPRKPSTPLISHEISFLNVFDQEEVWLGFSGSNGLCLCYSHYTVFDLIFKSWFTGPVLPSSPAATPDPLVPGRVPEVGQENSTTVTTDNAPVSVAVFGGIAFGSVAALSVTGFISWCLWARRRNRLRAQKATRRGGSFAVKTPEAAEKESQIAGLSHSLQMFTFKELQAATKNFDDALIVGEGGFGSVYRGQIAGTKQLVAVKKVSNDSKQGEREFQAEVTIISQLRHRNIVQLLGCCLQGPGKFLLVYEFMPNGSLHDALFLQKPCVLSWGMRFTILQGLAASLNYLHDGGKEQVLHRDVKPNNIMLDDKFNAMLGDFGLARMVAHCQMPAAITAVAGTYGYIAPEAAITGRFTTKTDVFAFGAVALEIACGRKAFDERHPEVFLVDWVWSKMAGDELFSCVDSRLVGKCELEQVELVLLLGLLCSHPDAGERPTMVRVNEILSGCREMPPIPRSKPTPEYSSDAYLKRMEKFTPSPEPPRNRTRVEARDNSSSSKTGNSESRSDSTSGLDYSDSITSHPRYADATYKS